MGLLSSALVVFWQYFRHGMDDRGCQKSAMAKSVKYFSLLTFIDGDNCCTVLRHIGYMLHMTKDAEHELYIRAKSLPGNPYVC